MNLMFWKKDASAAVSSESGEDMHESSATSSGQPSDSGDNEETADAPFSRRWLLAAVLGVVVLLIFSGIFWKLLQHDSHPNQPAIIEAAPAPVAEPLLGKPLIKLPPIDRNSAESAQVEQATWAEIDALKRSNRELEAQIKALKHQPSGAPVEPAANVTAPIPAHTGSIIVNNNDPKATAMTLKQAIDAMNALDRAPEKKPAQ